jgi:hypothetical protein
MEGGTTDEATRRAAAAVVASVLLRAAHSGLEDDGRGDPLHHIAEVFVCEHKYIEDGCAQNEMINGRSARCHIASAESYCRGRCVCVCVCVCFFVCVFLCLCVCLCMSVCLVYVVYVLGGDKHIP